MCKVGDIIVVKECKVGGKLLTQHSFIVLNTDEGKIEGMSYDMVCNIMSSFDGKGEDYKAKKLSYPENMQYEASEENIVNGHGKEGSIKAGLFFFFNKKEIDYYVLGNVDIELYLRLIKYIQNMDKKDLRNVLDNLK